jgi:hypothetical protein
MLSSKTLVTIVVAFFKEAVAICSVWIQSVYRAVSSGVEVFIMV